MTRSTTGPKLRGRARATARPVQRKGYWILQDAKARLSEVVRRARSDGPQHVTVHGRNGVVVIAEEEFRLLKGEATGRALVAALQSSPSREIEIEPKRTRMPVREIDLS